MVSESPKNLFLFAVSDLGLHCLPMTGLLLVNCRLLISLANSFETYKAYKTFGLICIQHVCTLRVDTSC